MFSKLIRNFVVNYIKKSIAHSHRQDRDAIFKAVNDGMREEFNEDNIHTRVYCTIKWLLLQDTEFITFAEFKDDSFVNTVAHNARDAVLDSSTKMSEW